ncbi:hypothetical protein M3Y95_00683900 [Aphelenchoides besseyi]|nr:hypothetical protein M3Y95_00683900 [Aphelenchoides besseyi]
MLLSRQTCLRLLLFACLFYTTTVGHSPPIRDPDVLEFTATSYNLSIPEDHPVNATVWNDGTERIGVYLPRGYNSAKFKIVKGDKDQVFLVSARPVGDFVFLIVSLKPEQLLNRELQDEFVLVVKATAKRKNGATHEATATLNIVVRDANDLLSFFQDSSYAKTIDENFPVNGKVIQLKGVDADIGLNGELLFSLVTPSDQFYVEPRSGWIRSFARLKPGTHVLQVHVQDRASRLFYDTQDSSLPAFQNLVDTTITVVSSEHRPPRLAAQPIALHFYHDAPQAAAVLTINEVDRDVSVELSGEIEARGDTFLKPLAANRFLLSVARIQNKSPGPISLIVRDRSLPNGTFTAENIPLEMNVSERRVWFDGATEEETPRLQLRVNESLPSDYVIYEFRANTTFIEDQRHLKYRIHGKEAHKLPLHLDKSTGQLRLKSRLSRSSQSLYEFSVVAKLDDVEEKAFVDVSLEVVGSNVNCPQFKGLPKGYRVVMKSRMPSSSEVLRVKAEDADVDENGRVTYKMIGINGSDSYFSIDAINGNIRLLKELPTKEHRWQIKVMAVDSGWPRSHFATAILQFVTEDAPKSIELTDIESLFNTCSVRNIHAPKIGQPSEFVISEDIAIGHTVGQVTATDDDDSFNGALQFIIAPDAYFGIDVLTGRIFVRNPLSPLLESQRRDHFVHDLVVTVRDQSIEDPKNSSVNVKIRINRVNSHDPVFEKFAYRVHVTENTVPSDELLRLHAEDADHGANGRVEYRLAVEIDFVSIDPDSGSLRLEKALDREAQPEIKFLVFAVDRGQPPRFGFANVTLVVDDQNDSPPQCGREVHESHVLEDAPNNQLVMCMAAFDADVGQSSKLQFAINTEIPFRIDRESGCIFTNLTRPLDYEIQSAYEFSVTVNDQGTPSLSTECAVRVLIVDVNENLYPPRFTDVVYEANLDENQPRGIEITRVRAVDPEGTKIRYELVDGSGLGFVEVDRDTGIIRSSVVLDYERTPNLWLTVRATDGDPNFPLQSHTHVYIRVNDINDAVPMFSQPVYLASVIENSEPNKVIIRVNATDFDASAGGLGSPVTYRIERGNPQSNFVLDENTGYLVTGYRHLDREVQSEHELYVQACDRGTPQLCTSALVLIKVRDQNDCAPRFRDLNFNLTLPANQTGFLARVFADDADEDGPNAELSYTLEGDKRVQIDSFGQISAIEPLVAGTSIQLTIFAEDNGEPRLRTNASVRLTAVAPVSKSAATNHLPVFVSPEKWRHLYVSDHDSVGTVLGRIEVDDADHDPLWFRISEQSSNPNQTFAFHSSTGELVLARRANLIDIRLRKVEMEIVVSDGFAEISDKIYIHVTRSTATRPQFDESEVTITLSEDQPAGFVLYTARAHFDHTNTGISHPVQLTYGIHSITDVFASDYLRIDSSSGKLILDKQLPEEGVSDNFSVIISANVGGGFENFAVVHIKRASLNRHAPTFVFEKFDFEFDDNSSEEQPIGQIRAFDVDRGENGRIVYSVISRNEESSFVLNSETGTIRLVNPIEVPSEVVWTVRASDSSPTSPLSNTCIVRLHRRVNESSTIIPTFNNTMSVITLDPTTHVGTSVALLNATADDFLTFELQERCDPLTVDFASGIVRLRRVVGSELSTWSVNCTFLANAFGAEHPATMNVLVRLPEPLDRSIHFKQTNFVAYTHELAVKGTSVFADSLTTKPFVLTPLRSQIPTQNIRYRLLAPQESYFALDANSGALRTLEPIDRRQHLKWETFAIAFDTETSDASAPLRIQINVLETNRHSPLFQLRNHSMHINETETLTAADQRHFLVRLEALDEDVGNFGRLCYSLLSNQSSSDAAEYFSVHETTGDVLLIKPLDRETHDMFNLTVEVVDGGGLKDQTNLTVIVDDSNDNRPEFEHSLYQLKVLENEAVGYVIQKLVAHDRDATNHKLRFELADSNFSEFVDVDSSSGVLRLAKSLDYEKMQNLTIEVIVRDSGKPPMESRTTVELEVLDVNDNSPRFDQTLYETTVNENCQLGTRIVQVHATDADSAHFGSVSYSLSGENADYLTITDDGWVEVAREIDYEQKKLLRATIRAVDGGMPALSDEALLTITIIDVNDNKPQFSTCNLNAVVQEGVQAGQSLLSISLNDADSEANGPPFRLEIHGDSASAFTFDPLLNLITTRQLSYAEQREFKLNVTAYDSGGLSSTCPLTVLVKQASRHTPEVRPQLITLNTLYGEYLGGSIGRIYATDKDPADSLRFGLVDAVSHAPTSLAFDASRLRNTVLRVDSTTGELTAAPDLLPGLHRFNISVTDGKFVVHSPVTIDVADISQEALDHSLSVHLSGLNAEKFVRDHLHKFIAILARILSVPATYVRLLSVQDVRHDELRHKRQSVTPFPTVVASLPPISQLQIELLLTVSRGEARGFHRPSYVKQKISEGIAQLTAESGLEITSLTSEVCRSDTCTKGECRDRLWLDNTNMQRIGDESESYLFPRFARTYVCHCPVGAAGRHCDVAINKCSRDLCSKHEMCIPNDRELSGVICSCPPGLKGERCSEASCDRQGECAQRESISLLGDGYFQMLVTQKLESKMDLMVEFKTVSRNGVLFHGSGIRDFHTLLIVDGHLKYQFDSGSGVGVVSLTNVRVDDGLWHELKVTRRGRQAKLSLNGYENEGSSPSGSDVINLYEQAEILTFGAQVMDQSSEHKNINDWFFELTHHRHHGRQIASELASRVVNGTIGCIGRIALDGFELSKTEQGLRLFNARIGCDPQTLGPCLNAPCNNGGQCIPKEGDSAAYSCLCNERYTGANCEIDLNACAGNPCPHGIQCHNLYNDFHCSCPPGFTGKTCQMRGNWDPCVTSPCGSFGRCERHGSTFACNCSAGYGGTYCTERVPRMYNDDWTLGSLQLYILCAILLFALICAVIVIVVCRRRNSGVGDGKTAQISRTDSGRLPSDDPTNPLVPVTPRVAPPIYHNTVERRAPPIPPKNTGRPTRSTNMTLLSSGLPTVEVRPMRSNGVAARPLDSPFANTPVHFTKGSIDSTKKHGSEYDETYEPAPKPQPPPHRFVLQSEEQCALLNRGVITEHRPTKTSKNDDTKVTTSLSSLDNASSMSDYVTMKPIKKKEKKPENDSQPPALPVHCTSPTVENGNKETRLYDNPGAELN